MKEIYEFLKNAKIYYLATVENNQARVRPFGTIDLVNNRLYFQTGKTKDVSKQMKINPHIEISTMYQDKWIRISAEAVLDDNILVQQHILDAYPSLKNMYQPGDGNTEVFYLKNGTATIYSFTESVKVITF